MARLALLLRGSEADLRWRYLAEFLEEYSWETAVERLHLLDDPPASTDDERWDALLAAPAEHLAALDGRGSPAWVDFKPLHRFWFPFNTPAARADAVVNAPAAFRRRGIFLSAHELDVA